MEEDTPLKVRKYNNLKMPNERDREDEDSFYREEEEGESLERWAVGGWQGQIISHTTHSMARDNRSPHS